MKRLQKLLSMLLVLAMLISCIPVSALAEETAEAIVGELTEQTAEEETLEEEIPEEEIPAEEPAPQNTEEQSQEPPLPEESASQDSGTQTDREELTEETLPQPETLVCEEHEHESGMTAEELFDGYVRKTFLGMEDVSVFSTGLHRGYYSLNDTEKQIYDQLLPLFREMANGERDSLTVDMHAFSEETPVTFEGDFDFWEPINMLEYDYPYETYWLKRSHAKYYPGYEGIYRVIYSFEVEKDFRGADSYTANTAKTGAAQKAAKRANEIVYSVRNKSEYEQLTYFCNQLCQLVTYDHDAAKYGSNAVGGGPWDVIHAFDGDPTTNIVCGGYARSFQYLCDLADIQCYYITGDSPNAGNDYHAWNIVTLDGKNYHVDVTWVDPDGGSNYFDFLFLAGGTGSPYTGYTFSKGDGRSYTYIYEGDHYDRGGGNMLEIWGEEVLTLESSNYDPATAACTHNYTRQITTTPYFDRDGVYTYTCTRCGNQYTESFHECWYRYTVVEPTCTEQGYTAMSCHCKKPFDNFDFKPALGHEAEAVPAKEPTCYSTGLSAGQKCSRCDAILKAQTTVAKADHKYENDACIWCGIVGGNLVGDTYWRFSENTGTLTIKGTGPMEDFTQEKWQPWYAFHEPGSITRVVLEEGVTTIGSNAFSNLDSLTEVILPESLETVGFNAFNGCDALTEIVLPRNVKTIDILAFGECSKLEKITIPYGVTTIGDAAFSDCVSLKDIYLPSSVKNLGGRVFAGCTGFTAISLPYNVEVLEDYLFQGCTNLTEVTLPSNLKSVGYGAFENCTGLTTVNLPDSVTSIDNSAFFGCTNLENLKLPASLESLGSDVFFDCGKVKQLTLPAGLKSLGMHAFYNSGINCVEFLGDAPQIHQYAFSWITALVLYPADNDTWNEETMQQYGGELYWMEAGYSDDLSGFCGDQVEWQYDAESCTLTLSGSGEMYNYNSGSVMLDDPNPHPWLDVAPQIRYVVVEDDISGIGEYAFYNCISLQDIVIPESVSFIGSHAFYGCIQLESVDLPAGLREIEPFVFYGCDSLTDVVIPDGVTVIGNKAFSFCEKLERITIPNTVSVIGGNSLCFTALKEITMPRSLTELGYWALEANHQLSKVTFTGDAPVFDDIGRSGIFKDCASNISVYYPGNLDGWTEDVRLQYGVAEGYQVTWIPTTAKTNYCGSDLQWNLSGTTLTITGSGNMFHYSEEKPAPWANSNREIRKVVLPEGMTSIGDKAFAGCSNLTEITIHGGIRSIGAGAFENSGLEKVFFRSDPPELAEDAFAGVTANVHYQDNLNWRGRCRDYGGALTWIDTYPVTYELRDILEEGGTGTQMLNKLKGLNQLQLEHAMAAQDGETARLVAQLENSLGIRVGVNVQAGTDSTISGLFDKVTEKDLVGAAANAAAGKTAVNLVFGNAPEGLEAGGKFDPEKTLLFSMTLEGAENSASLDVPVLITLPLPAGADGDKLRILHYWGTDAAPEELDYRLDGEKVSFAVTGFSAFGLAFIAEPAAQVGETEYPSLSQAIAAAGIGGRVRLLRDVKEEVPVSQEVTIEKNGFTANLKASAAYACRETAQEYQFVAAKARIGEKGYVSLRAALADAKTTDTIVLLAKPDTAETICQAVRIDLNNVIASVPVAAGWKAVKCQDSLWTVAKDSLPGDVNEDRKVSDADAAHLLWYVLFPEVYPIEVHADFDCSGTVDTADVQYLIWHTLFPTVYPLR